MSESCIFLLNWVGNGVHQFLVILSLFLKYPCLFSIRWLEFFSFFCSLIRFDTWHMHVSLSIRLHLLDIWQFCGVSVWNILNSIICISVRCKKMINDLIWILKGNNSGKGGLVVPFGAGVWYLPWSPCQERALTLHSTLVVYIYHAEWEERIGFDLFI